MLKPRATITTMRWILLATLAVIDFYIYDFLFWVWVYYGTWCFDASSALKGVDSKVVKFACCIGAN
jgi:hypothetical protein